MLKPVVCSNFSPVDLVWILRVDFELRLIQFRDQVDREFLKADPLYQVFEVIFLVIWKTLSPVGLHHMNFGRGKCCLSFTNH